MAKPFQKGDDPRRNLKGRPKGSANKTTDQLRSLVADVISDNWQTFTQDIKSLDSDKRVMVIDRLLKHILPAPVDMINSLTPEQIDQVISELKKRYHEH